MDHIFVQNQLELDVETMLLLIIQFLVKILHVRPSHLEILKYITTWSSWLNIWEHFEDYSSISITDCKPLELWFNFFAQTNDLKFNHQQID